MMGRLILATTLALSVSAGVAHALPMPAASHATVAIGGTMPEPVDYYYRRGSALRKLGWYPGAGLEFCSTHPASYRCHHHFRRYF